MIGWLIDPMLLHWPGYVTRIYYVTLMSSPRTLNGMVTEKVKHLQGTGKVPRLVHRLQLYIHVVGENEGAIRNVRATSRTAPLKCTN